MKSALVILALAMLASGAFAEGGYGAPQEQPYQSKVSRHVYVHVAPDEPEDRQSRVIRVPGGDKHVNVIFVKTPSQSSSQQTEVVLPEQDEHKNLVYVLLKKGENNANIKVRGPGARRPTKPEVYFIRYKNQETGGAYGAPSGGTTGGISGPTPVREISNAYGAF